MTSDVERQDVERQDAERQDAERQDADPAVELRGLGKSFRVGEPVVEDVSLRVAEGEFMTLLGPSGSGKTTTLNMVAGFLRPDRGQVLLSGRDVSRVPVHERGLGMVFQHYSLFPHMTVDENVAFPLKQRKMPRAERVRRVGEALEQVRLAGLGSRKPAELSGGQQQRVALARSLVYRPRVLLMDEPLGALDKSLRQDLQAQIRALHQDLGLTFVFVTHDQEEALSLSDRIALFNAGRIEQLGTPMDLYDNPRSTFVADFIGVSNRFPSGQVRPSADGARFSCPDGTFAVAGAGSLGAAAALVVRPERVYFIEPGAIPPANVVSVTVLDLTYLGATRATRVRTPGGTTLTVVELTRSAAQVQRGDAVRVGWDAADGRLLSHP